MITDSEIVNKFIYLRESARKRGIPFDMSLKKIKSLLLQKKCFYTGIPFGIEDDLRRSVDRVDSSAGYTDSNVVACNVRINRVKSDATVEELKLVLKGIDKHNKK